MKFQFLHIEKTAGMSLHAMFHRDFFCYLSPDPRKQWNPDKKSMLVKNFSNGGHNIVRSRQFEFQFTILRDPIARYISHFNWRTNVMGESWTFDDFLEKDDYKDFQYNKLVHYTNRMEVTSILSEFSFVGIFEDMEKTMRILCDSLNLHPAPILENSKNHKNPIRKTDLSSTQLEICHMNNRKDQEIYDQACVIFDQIKTPNIELTDYESLGNLARIKQKSFNLLTRARR